MKATSKLAVLALALAPGCTKGEMKQAPTPAPSSLQSFVNPTALAELRAYDRELREKALRMPPAPSSRSLGANPYRLVALRDKKHLAGILRGKDELVVLDADLRALARAPTPELPSALVVAENGELFVSGELSSQIRVYRWDGKLVSAFVLDLDDV